MSAALPRRFQDWPARLEQAVESWRDRVFAWGSADCACFVCHCIEATTGVDLFAEVRGRYDDPVSAVDAIRGVAGSEALTVEDAASFYLGPPLVSPLLAQRGDVVSVSTAGGPALGICIGRDAVYAAPAGITTVGMPDWLRAWRV